MIIKDNITSVTKVYPSIGDPVYLVVCTDITCTVPHTNDNKDYQIILDWVADGNTITDPNGD